MANAAHSSGEPAAAPRAAGGALMARWWRTPRPPGDGDLNSWTRMARPPSSLPGS